MAPKQRAPDVIGGMDPMYEYFSAASGPDQQLSTYEIQRVLNSMNWTQFSVTTCEMMGEMLDRDRSGQMGFNEFKELMTTIQQWKGTFDRLDADKSGYIERPELEAALREFGYNLSPQFVNLLLFKFDYQTHKHLDLDKFVLICVTLRGLTDQFRMRDVSQNGTAKFAYDDFMQVALMFKP